MKIKAYTLMEVTIAMLLSALCITICYSAFGIVTGYYRAFHQKNQTADQVIALQHVLEKDLMRSNLVLRQADGLLLYADTTKIHYVFDADHILRKYDILHVDTFKLSTDTLQTYFEGSEKFNADTVDQVSFRVQLHKDITVPISINKYYSAKDLFR